MDPENKPSFKETVLARGENHVADKREFDALLGDMAKGSKSEKPKRPARKKAKA